MVANLAEYLIRHPADRVLYREFDGRVWRDLTAADVLRIATRWQRAYHRAGLRPGDRVAICARNGVAWVAADLAALGLGLIVVPLYASDHADSIAWCLGDSGAALLILENPRLLPALSTALAELPTTVLLEGESAPAVPVAAFLAGGPAPGGPRDGTPAAAQSDMKQPDRQPPGREAATPGGFVIRPPGAEALATVVYTSGTAGRPKGVMLSHANIIANVEAALAVVPVRDTDTMLSVLPLSHMFERTCGYYAPLALGVSVAFSRGVSHIAEDLAAVRPTFMVAVPRVFERFLARIDQQLAGSALKRRLFDAVVEAGWRRFQGRAGPLDELVYRLLAPKVAGPVLERLGGRLRLTFTGGAPLPARVARVFIGLGLNLGQGYGLTEASPVVSANGLEAREVASVGLPLPNLEVRLNEAGELLVRGPSVMRGYWHNEAASRAVLCDEGWLNTGDLADLEDGRVYIRGRSKDVLVLSNGEKLSPQAVEDAVLADPAFEQVMVVGEGRPFALLLAVSRESDEKALLKRANARLKGFPRYVRLRGVIIDAEPWTVENGLLTPTLKVKRALVYARFREAIERAYARYVD